MSSLFCGLPLFSFGTLMDEQLLSCVSGIESTLLSIKPASLAGFKQRLVVGEEFPVIIPESGVSVAGVAIFGLTEEAMKRILFYEGDEYRLTHIGIDVTGEGAFKSLFFETNDVYATRDCSWELNDWQQQCKGEFLLRVESYMKYYGTMNATEADKHW